MCSILIVDDDENLAQRMVGLLFSKGHQVTLAHTDSQDFRCVQRLCVDLVILNLMNNRAEGLQVHQQLRASPTLVPIPILFLTNSLGFHNKLEAFKPEVDDCLTEPFEFEELEFRVEALLKRHPQASSVASTLQLQVGSLWLNLRTFEASIEGKPLPLTPVEFKLLQCLMYYAGEIIPSERLLHEVWGYGPGTGSPELVRMHIRNLRAKIGVSFPTPFNIIQTVPRRGYTITQGLDELDSPKTENGSILGPKSLIKIK